MRFTYLNFSGLIVAFSSVLAVTAQIQNNSLGADVFSSITSASLSTETPQVAPEQLAPGGNNHSFHKPSYKNCLGY